MIGHRHTWLGWTACVALALWLGLAASAASARGVVSGDGLVVAKDIANGLITLDTGVILEVSPLTKITSAQGRRITIADLMLAPSEDGVVTARGEAMIHYSGTAGRDRIAAYSIRVIGQIPQ